MKDCNSAIENACRELNLNLLEVYYIELSKDVKMYDKQGNIISYDFRDIGYEVKTIKYVPKEDVVYINVELFNDKNNMLVKCYQAVRQAYQIKEVLKKKQNNETNEENYIRAWEYCYCQPENNKRTDITPVEADMMAFSIVMMEKYQHINIKFKENDYYGWETLLGELEKKYLK